MSNTTSKNKTVENNHLSENSVVFVRGKVSFSRISRLIEGEELKKDIANSSSRYPVTVPYGSLSMTNVQIIPGNPNSQADQLFKQFIEEHTFTYNEFPERQNCYNVIAKQQLPQFAQWDDPQGQTIKQVNPLEGELNRGTDVTFKLETYRSKTHGTIGFAVRLGIINTDGPIPYYGGTSTDDLSALGITGVVGNFTPQQPSNASVNTGTQPIDPNAAANDPSSFFSLGNDAAPSAPSQNQFSSAPQQTQQAPIQQVPQTQQVPQNATAQFAQQQAQQPAQQPTQSFAPAADQFAGNNNQAVQNPFQQTNQNPWEEPTQQTQQAQPNNQPGFTYVPGQ